MSPDGPRAEPAGATGVRLPECSGKGTPAGERAGRRVPRLLAAVGAGFLALAVLSSFLPGGGGQGGGSPSSSYSNRPDGTSAWAELLSRFNRHVDRLRGDLDSTVLDPATAVVVLDAPGLTGSEAEALAEFVRDGGHLVAGGVGADDWLESIVEEPLLLESRGVVTAGPVGTPLAQEVEEVRTVRAGRLGSWRDHGGLAPILAGHDGRVIALAGRSGLGRVVALADPSPVQNAFLAAEDNAALALGLAGKPDRRVFFAEGVHGYGAGEGLAALPYRWRLALVGLGLAAATWLIARSRRLGPPEDEARPLPPARWAYVDAVAGTLARTGRPHEAAEPVRRRARELIARRSALAADAEPAALYQAALRLGLPSDEAAAVLGTGPSDEAAVLAAGRALARFSGGEA